MELLTQSDVLCFTRLLKKLLMIPLQGYFKKVMRLCFSGLKTTTRIVRNIPGASLLMDKVAPGALGGMEEFVEAVISEMLANKVCCFNCCHH